MNRNFILGLILLATLSVLNAATTFEECNVFSDEAPINVTISPDPFILGEPITFTVFGKLTVDITTQTVVNISFNDHFGSHISLFSFPICNENTKCPILARNEFSMVATVNVPASLPSKYIILVRVLNSTQLFVENIDKPYSLGCAIYYSFITSSTAGPSKTSSGSSTTAITKTSGREKIEWSSRLNLSLGLWWIIWIFG
ncbi:5127_t:CDS:1, partial [Acaulospora morrowiae]